MFNILWTTSYCWENLTGLGDNEFILWFSKKRKNKKNQIYLFSYFKLWITVAFLSQVSENIHNITYIKVGSDKMYLEQTTEFFMGVQRYYGIYNCDWYLQTQSQQSPMEWPFPRLCKPNLIRTEFIIIT